MIGKTLDPAAIASLKEDATRFLMELVSIRSYPNEEREACDYCAGAFAAIPGVEVRRIPIPGALKEHPLFCPGPAENFDYAGHFNVEVVWKGTGGQEPVYLNAHLDTVTMGQDTHLLPPRRNGDTVYGLGACDDKGPVASIYTVFKLLSAGKVRLPYDVVGHLVVEEEVGGNGALAITDPVMNRLLIGQAAVVLEPTAGAVLPVARNGLWMKIVAHGAASHTAAIHAGKSKNALALLLRAIDATRAVHAEYQAECAANPVRYYEDHTPPFNIGTLHSGDWPAKVSPVAEAVISVAVLPNRTNADMRQKLLAAIDADDELRGRVELRFVFDRGSCITDFDDPYVRRFARYVQQYGYSGRVDSMKALSDMYFYRERLGIPCVTFGPGNLLDAHSADEKVDINDVLQCGYVLYDWIRDGQFSTP